MAGSAEFDFERMLSFVTKQAEFVEAQVKELEAGAGKSFDPTKMFRLQLNMNLFNQSQEGVSSTMAGIHQAISSTARKISS